jgi:hypothetical protein
LPRVPHVYLMILSLAWHMHDFMPVYNFIFNFFFRFLAENPVKNEKFAYFEVANEKSQYLAD